MGGRLHRTGLFADMSKISGIGVYCVDALEEGDCLGVYSGKLMAEDDFNAMAAHSPSIRDTAMDLPHTDHVVVRAGRDDLLSYVNEVPPERKANVAVVPIFLPAGNAVAYYAARRIAAGDELVVHYGQTYCRSYRVGGPARAPARLEPLRDVLSDAALADTRRYCAPRAR